MAPQLDKQVSRRSFLATASLSTTGLLLYGCGGSSDKTATKAGGTSAARAKQEITYLAGEPLFGTLDPVAHFIVTNFRVQHQWGDPLVDFDEKLAIKPALAEAWRTINANTWEFDLREDVKFQNGAPFTADSVKATIEHLLNPKVASPQAVLWPKMSVKVISDSKVRIETEVPFGALLSNLTSLIMLEPGAIADVGTKPVGTSPFRVAAFEAGRKVTMEAWDGSWRGTPKIQTVVFETVADTNTRLAAIKTGAANWIDRIPYDQLKGIQGDKSLRLEVAATTEVQWPFMDCSKAPTDNADFRRAMNLAVDRAAIRESVMAGVPDIETNPLSRNAFGASADLGALRYDPDEAKRLLDASGASSEPLVYYTGTGFYPQAKQVSDATVAYLQDVGITVKHEIREFGDIPNLFTKHAGNMYTNGWLLVTADWAGGAPFLWNGKNNDSTLRYDNPVVNEALDAGGTEIDAEKRQAAYDRANTQIWQDCPMLWMWDARNPVVKASNVQGLPEMPNGVSVVTVDTEIVV